MPSPPQPTLHTLVFHRMVSTQGVQKMKPNLFPWEVSPVTNSSPSVRFSSYAYPPLQFCILSNSFCGPHASALQITLPKPAQALSGDFDELPLPFTP